MPKLNAILIVAVGTLLAMAAVSSKSPDAGVDRMLIVLYSLALIGIILGG